MRYKIKKIIKLERIYNYGKLPGAKGSSAQCDRYEVNFVNKKTTAQSNRMTNYSLRIIL